VYFFFGKNVIINLVFENLSLVFCPFSRPPKSKKGELDEISREVSEETKKRKAEIEKKLEEEQKKMAMKCKRKSKEAADPSLPSKVPKLNEKDGDTFDYSQVDFKKLFASSKAENSPSADFNPNRGNKQQQDKRQSAGKAKQRMKGGGRGMTFKNK
jgi:DNA topoisomerase VI subunit B